MTTPSEGDNVLNQLNQFGDWVRTNITEHQGGFQVIAEQLQRIDQQLQLHTQALADAQQAQGVFPPQQQAPPAGGDPNAANNPQAQAPAVMPPPARVEVRLMAFSGSEHSEYSRWESHVTRCLAANGWTFPRAAHAILSALKDKAADMASQIDGDNYRDWPALREDLRRLFLSTSYRAKARAEYEKRKQLDGEDLCTYHGLLVSLRNDAFIPAERSEPRLIEHFIAGIKNEETHKQMHVNMATAECQMTMLMH